MAQQIKFLIDNLDRGQPLNPEDFGISITEDTSIGARIVSFDNELIFGGDVFSYLYNKLAINGYCELVRVSVQYKCATGIWEKLVDGYIIVTESTFDLDKCQVKTKLYDETFSTKINNNKAIPFSLKLTKTKNGIAITPPTLRTLALFNPATGLGIVPNTKGYSVYDVFKHLIACMTDDLVDFESNFFFTNYTFDEYPLYVVTQGDVMRGAIRPNIIANFESLYGSLRKKLNIGMGFEKQSNGRPLLRIEDISYFQQSTPSVNLYDQPNIEMKFDTSRLYQAAEFGCSPVLEANECDSGNTPCTFTQTPFRGFRNETFGFTGECNTSNILGLKTDDVIFDTNVIEDVVRFNNESYDLNIFIIVCRYSDITNRFIAQQFDIYGTGQSVYNALFNNESVSANWLSGYPNSLYSYLNGFDAANTIFENRAVGNNQCFDIVNTNFTSYAAFTGNFLSFPNQIQDTGNNFDGSTYVVPAAGLYSFQLSVSLGGIFITGDRWGAAIIKHYDSAGVFIADYQGAVVQGIATNAIVCTSSATFVCNEGDKIRADVAAVLVGLATGPLQQCINFQNPSITFFSGSGVPFTPSTLQPVDIDDVQAYLYKFKRPLTMAEINAITSETSKPILLGRQDDALATIPTYIKRLQIDSVLRKTAQLELRSNKLIQ
jgi:hypothetical protein